MDYSNLKEQICSLINFAQTRKSEIKLAIIATTKDGPSKKIDYKLHSVSTSYLSRQELEELVASFRNYCDYLEVYTDIEDFLRDYYTKTQRVRPTIIFETSAKGIGRGRDALIPALCDVLGYPHVGAEATSSVLCSSKYQWTSILRQNGIQVPDSYLYIHGRWISPPPVGIKYILKLNYECASIGLSSDSVMINDGTNLQKKAAELQKNYGQPVIAQAFIEGYEVEVPVLINRIFRTALPPVGLATTESKYYKEQFFDYDSIYFDDYSLYDFSEVMPTAVEHLRQCAHKVIDILDLTGYMRVDFRINADGKFFVFDINNDPCINSCGSFYKSLELLDIDPQGIAGVILGNKLI